MPYSTISQNSQIETQETNTDKTASSNRDENSSLLTKTTSRTEEMPLRVEDTNGVFRPLFSTTFFRCQKEEQCVSLAFENGPTKDALVDSRGCARATAEWKRQLQTRGSHQLVQNQWSSQMSFKSCERSLNKTNSNEHTETRYRGEQVSSTLRRTKKTNRVDHEDWLHEIQ